MPDAAAAAAGEFGEPDATAGEFHEPEPVPVKAAAGVHAAPALDACATGVEAPHETTLGLSELTAGAQVAH